MCALANIKLTMIFVIKNSKFGTNIYLFPFYFFIFSFGDNNIILTCPSPLSSLKPSHILSAVFQINEQKYMHICALLFKIYKFNVFCLYNITGMYVFSADRWYWITNWCLLLLGELLLPLFSLSLFSVALCIRSLYKVLFSTPSPTPHANMTTVVFAQLIFR